MSSHILSRAVRRTCPSPTAGHSLIPVLCVKRRASLNSAIGRGLRKSKGVGFRSRERLGHAERTPAPAVVRRTADIKLDRERISLTREGWKNGRQGSENRQKVPNRWPGESAPDGNRNKGIRRNQSSMTTDDRRHGGTARTSRAADSTMSARRSSTKFQTTRSQDQETLKSGWEARRTSGSSDTLRNPRHAGVRRDSNEGGRNVGSTNGRPNVRYDDARDRNSPSNDGAHAVADDMIDPRGRQHEDRRNSRIEDRVHIRHDVKSNSKYATKHFDDEDVNRRRSDPQMLTKTQSSVEKSLSSAFDHRMPVAVPHTTPASEFLYGTSVVEAALRSQQNPRRILYKLYTYVGEKRDDSQQDANIQRLARKIGLEIVRISRDGLRMLDKMSTGRPHNGYILEASPLPRLPIVSLGDFSDEDGHIGFKVKLDHQTREEAAVNGCSDFVRVLKNFSGRKPFVLLLDGILDPGNLGSIIRTAAFLGVSGVAISTRNSAPFSPIVLKASAGASETVTLFSVAKPAGFIADSRACGWRIYAAVAPSKDSKSSIPFKTSDRLDNPLSSTPCILMLGGEGEGLRWSLRSKADIDVAVQGSSHRGAVDSLNVGVAAGILCDAFLSGKPGIANSDRAKTLKDTAVEADLF